MTELALIAAGMTALIESVPGVPLPVKWRKNSMLEEGERVGVVIMCGVENIFSREFGGTVLWSYPWAISIYEPVADHPDLASNMDADDVRPSLVKAIKDVLSARTIAGTRVWDFDLAQSSAWERQRFKDGVELSQFGVLYRTSENS